MKNVKLMTVATLAALSLSTAGGLITQADTCLLYTSPSPRDTR